MFLCAKLDSWRTEIKFDDDCGPGALRFDHPTKTTKRLTDELVSANRVSGLRSM